jgi:hypothetical protein
MTSTINQFVRRLDISVELLLCDDSTGIRTYDEQYINTRHVLCYVCYVLSACPKSESKLRLDVRLLHVDEER